MNKKCIGRLPLYDYDHISYYPFACKQKDHTEYVYLIRPDDVLEKFCQFPYVDTDEIRLYQALRFQNSYLACQVYKNDELTYGIFAKNQTRKIYIQSHRFLYTCDVRAISTEYYTCKNAVISFDDSEVILNLDLGDDGHTNASHLIQVLSVDKNKVILAYEDTLDDLYKIFSLDLDKKEIIKTLILSKTNFHELVCLSHEEFALIINNGIKNHIIIEVYNASLNKMKTIEINDFFYDLAIDAVKKTIYLLMEKGIEAYKINYVSGKIEKVTIPKYSKNWDSIGCINGYLYFQPSAKKIRIFDTELGTLEDISFDKKIYNAFEEYNRIYVMTANEAVKNINTNALIEEGDMEIYCLS